MKKINTIAALILLTFINIYPQGLDTTNWFPYKTGNMWEYYVIEGISVVDTFQIINIRDSVMANGKIYLTQNERFINPTSFNPVHYIIDTAAQEVSGFNNFGDNIILYKFYAQQGDQWVMFPYIIGGYEMARVNGIYQDILFGINTTFMDVYYYGAADSTDTTGLDRYGVTIAKGFGLTYRGGGDIFYRLYLKGAVIDGILYGDTTQIVVSVDDPISPLSGLPETIELLQNYPNPFNPQTNITFKVGSISDISLSIYDNIGREVRKLIDNASYLPGEYRITWNGKDENGKKAASGIYFCRLSNGYQNLFRSMVLLK